MTNLREEILDDIPPRGFPWTAGAFTDLILRPEDFFKALLKYKLTATPYVVIWIVGMARVVDRIDTRQMISQAMGSTRPAPVPLSSWPSLWGGVMFWGVLIGLLVWFIGGLWYRLRLRFCGIRGVDPGEARRVYIYAELVLSAPSMLVLLLVSFTYPDYQAASMEAPLSLALLSTLYWSIWVSYRGAVGYFNARTASARVWFLILPMSLVSIFFLGAMVIAMGTWL